MIYAIDNGETHDDHSIDFVETDLAPGELAELLEIEHGPADQQVHRWTKIPDPGIGIGYPERAYPKAHAREIPYLLFIADVSTWAPDLEYGGFHGGSSAARLTKTPRGEIYWLARESTGRLEQLVKVERARAIEDLAAKATGHPRANGHPKWEPFEPIRAELEWRQTGKTCGCGRHHTARAWLELEHARFQFTPEDDEGSAELLECRHCKCGSTIARLHRLPFAWRRVTPLGAAVTARRLEERTVPRTPFTLAGIGAGLRPLGVEIADANTSIAAGPRGDEGHRGVVNLNLTNGRGDGTVAGGELPPDRFHAACEWVHEHAPRGVLVNVTSGFKHWTSSQGLPPLEPPV